jgi:hypothetical protein
MSNAIQVFGDYAAAFEETFADDDWSRLEQYFAEDARYEISGGPFATVIEGRDAILAGLKKSVDGFDRKFDHREIELTTGPAVTSTEGGDELRMTWNVHYRMNGAPDISLPGGSMLRINDGVIQLLRDEYNDEELGEIGAWLAEHGAGLDGSYV